MIRRPPRSTRVRSSAASDVYKRQSKVINIASADVGFLAPMLGLTAAPEAATAVPNVICPFMYLSVKQYLVRFEPQYFCERTNDDADRCAVARSRPAERFRVVLIR